MVTLHVDSARSGWIGRTAEVSVDGLDDSHFFPNGNETVTAVVTNCHEDAYIDCTWIGGEGISFSDDHSLSTTINWISTNGVAWATNYVDLVTTYEGGYAITNRHGITVGTQTEPSTEFSLACQKVFFVNENEYEQETYVPNYMPERIRPVTVGLRGDPGLRGSVSFTVSEWSSDDISSNEDGAVLFQVVDGVTNRMFSTSVVPLEIEASCIGREDSETVLMSCPSTGKGVLLATLTLTNGCTMSRSAPFKVVDPIRRLVTTEKLGGRPVNPSRLVWGTNAVLHVDAFGGGDGLSPEDVRWKVLDGPGELANSNGFYNVVTPTAGTGVVKIEARMNDDEIQPTFELPVVRERVVPLRLFVVEPPESQADYSWDSSEIQDCLDEANWIFQQVGIRFEVLGPVEYGLPSESWAVGKTVKVSNSFGGVSEVIAPDAARLLGYFQNKSDYVTNDCIEVYFTGAITEDGVAAYSSRLGIVVSRLCSAFGFAHELGHALGLNDSYPTMEEDRGDDFPPVLEHRILDAGRPVDRLYFCNGARDWGRESGRGFYSPIDRRVEIGPRMLMYGFDTGPSHWDIPDGMVESLFGYGDNPFITVNARVGADHIKKTNAEVYTK